jgi:hypothetical protein
VSSLLAFSAATGAEFPSPELTRRMPAPGPGTAPAAMGASGVVSNPRLWISMLANVALIEIQP